MPRFDAAKHHWLWMALALLAPAVSGAGEPVKVQTRSFEELAKVVTDSVPAEVVSLNQALISAELNARVVAVEAQVGDHVARDDVLARLDCRDYEIQQDQAQAALQRLEAQLTLAESQLRRAEQLARERNISEDELERARSELAVRRAQRAEQVATLASAQRKLVKCSIRAPFDGVVSERHAQRGALAAPGEPMFEVVDVETVEVSARLRPDEVDSLLQSEDAHFQTDEQRFPVTVRAVVPAADPRSRDQEVRLRFDQARAIPGLSGRLTWTLQDLRLPAELLVQRDGRLGVFTVNGNAAHFVPLPGAKEGRDSPARLAGDTRIVVQGQVGLVDGHAVAEIPR
jgi:RND family efflux transporter MFP subunit